MAIIGKDCVWLEGNDDRFIFSYEEVYITLYIIDDVEVVIREKLLHVYLLLSK